MIFLVIAFHTTITYSHIGSWYYNAPGNVDIASGVTFFAFEAHCQAFFMGLLFLLAGYFVPGAYDRKGFRCFMSDRLMRLGVPSLIYIFVLQPLLEHYLLGQNDSLLDYYHHYILSGDLLTVSGPLWFAIALLVFSMVYAVMRVVRPLMANKPPKSVPGWKGLVLAGLGLGVVSFLVRVVQPLGTNVLNMQLCFFSQYIAMFAAGFIAFRNQWFERVPAQLARGMLMVAAVLCLAAFLPLVMWGGFPEHGLAPYLGGWRWQSAAYALWEQLAGVGLCSGLLVLYRDRFNSSGRISKLMAQNSFGIYFLHAPLVVAVTQTFDWLRLPPIPKAAVMIRMAFVTVLAFVHL
jgi:hypothetical protein